MQSDTAVQRSTCVDGSAASVLPGAAERAIVEAL
jgi:hypothetical protein